MDVNELFKKRKLEEEVEASKKSLKYSEVSDLKILDLIKGDEDNLNFETEVYDITWLKKLLLNVNKAMINNTELRTKFPNDPSKFLDSEFELNESIKALSGLSLVEDHSLLEHFCTNKITFNMVSLLKSHPNLDILIQLIRIINELVDFEDVLEEEDETLKKSFASLFLETKFTYLLCDHIIKEDRLYFDPLTKESVKIETVVNIMNSLDLLTKLTRFAELNKYLVDDKKLLKFVFSKLEIKNVSEITELSQSFAEFVFSLITNTGEVKLSRVTKILEKYNLIEILLINLSKFMKQQRLGETEVEEYSAYIADTLCYLLSASPYAKAQFLKNEGLELLFMIFNKQENLSLVCIKVISKLITSNDDESFNIAPMIINKGGLKYLFKYLHKSNDSLVAIESLFRLLALDSNERVRLFNKLLDKEGKNFKRLVKLRSEYLEMEEETEEAELSLDAIQHLERIISWCLIDDDLKQVFNDLAKDENDALRKNTLLQSLDHQIEQLQEIIIEDPLESVTYEDVIRSNVRETVDMLIVLRSRLQQ